MRDVTFKLLAVPLVPGLLALAACSGSAVVTVTATPSSDSYIAYQVGLTSVQLQYSGGKPGLALVPGPLMVPNFAVSRSQSMLSAPHLATGMTAVGLYTASTHTFSATSITLFFNN